MIKLNLLSCLQEPEHLSVNEGLRSGGIWCVTAVLGGLFNDWHLNKEIRVEESLRQSRVLVLSWKITI